ncbi:MAG: carboxypeptidase-like regulatory domain-containing protein [Flavobacteriaceae bacterium]|nr:carboxypeptidase-like regulatory domain-containing protein [Flavobacteriaceae bacterium]
MPKYVIFLLTLGLPSHCLQSQTSLVGQVIDNITQEPLPYVNIGLVNENIGTVSDEQGYFQLDLEAREYNRSTLRFSMIGFETKNFNLQDFIQKEILVIPLKEQATELKEVVVETKRTEFQTKTLGNKTTSKLIYVAFTSNKLGNEMGYIVRQRKRPMILKNFTISIVENEYGPIRFRLNFYSVENGLPTSTLLKNNIIIETDVISGIVTKDLSSYQIVIDEDFFVAIEWIEDLGPGNLFFSGGFFGSPLIAREVSQGSWSKVGAASVGMNVEVRF